MSVETQQLHTYMLTFARKWDTAPEETPEREVQRRNCLLSFILLKQQELREVEGFDSEAATAILAYRGLRTRADWNNRTKALFTSIQSPTHEPLPKAPIELLRSLDAEDGRFYYNLDVPVS